jgi:hypothetical protein
MAIAKEKISVRNSIAYGKLGPAAKAATKLKRDRKKKERKRLKDEKEAKSEALDAPDPDANPLYAVERRLRFAVSKLRKKVTDPKTLAELEKKKKKLMEVRQRLKAEKEAKREALDAADPDNTAVKNRKYCREYIAERRMEKALEEKNEAANIMMRVRDINYKYTGDGGVETIEEEVKIERSEEEEIEEEGREKKRKMTPR